MTGGAWASLALAGVLAGGCGYHVGGRAPRLPASVKTIAVPAIENRTSRYRIEQLLTDAVVHELISRTSYRVVADPAGADVVLHGKVTAVESSALLFDTTTGRATTMLVTVRCELLLEERETQNVLYRNDNFLFRNEYEISTDVNSFFEEQDPALRRLAQDFAKRLVSAVVEGF